jgi:hypothetical protein
VSPLAWPGDELTGNSCVVFWAEMWRELIFFIIFHFGASQRPQQQWYLTGKNFNDHRNRTKYESEVINVWSLSKDHSGNHLDNSNTTEREAMNYTHSSFGGAIAFYMGHNTTVDIAIEKLLHEVLRPHFQAKDRVKETETESATIVHPPYQLEIVDVWQYDILVSVNQDDPLQYEIGLYDLPRFEKHDISHPSHPSFLPPTSQCNMAQVWNSSSETWERVEDHLQYLSF